MLYLFPSTKEWNAAWAQLVAHPLNIELPDPETASNNGEIWEYLGFTSTKHTFRHNCHPSTGKVEHLHFPITYM